MHLHLLAPLEWGELLFSSLLLASAAMRWVIQPDMFEPDTDSPQEMSVSYLRFVRIGSVEHSEIAIYAYRQYWRKEKGPKCIHCHIFSTQWHCKCQGVKSLCVYMHTWNKLRSKFNTGVSTNRKPSPSWSTTEKIKCLMQPCSHPQH